MKNMLEHKGYVGSVHYSSEDRVFYGKVEMIRDLVSFEGTDVDSLNAAFREAVEDYLELCQEQGKTPDKPFKGSFNVRTGPELHRKAAMFAQRKKTGLNRVVVEALEAYLARENAEHSAP